MLERRLNVALQNSRHSVDTECPLYTPDNAQNLLLGYVEVAHSESPSLGSAFML